MRQAARCRSASGQDLAELQLGHRGPAFERTSEAGSADTETAGQSDPFPRSIRAQQQIPGMVIVAIVDSDTEYELFFTDLCNNSYNDTIALIEEVPETLDEFLTDQTI